MKTIRVVRICCWLCFCGAMLSGCATTQYSSEQSQAAARAAERAKADWDDLNTGQKVVGVILGIATCGLYGLAQGGYNPSR